MTDTHAINGHGLAEDPKMHLVHLVDHAAHLLPTQGPIGVFVHHNTLHAFQHKMFDEAVAEASKLYGRQPYLTEAAFRAELKRGRILPADVEAILEREEDEEILPNRLVAEAIAAIAVGAWTEGVRRANAALVAG
jgi:uncharacterized protein